MIVNLIQPLVINLIVGLINNSTGTKLLWENANSEWQNTSINWEDI